MNVFLLYVVVTRFNVITTYCIKCVEEQNGFYTVLCTVNFKINIMSFGNEIGKEIGKQLFNKLLIPFAIVFAIGFALGAWLL